MIQAMSKSEYVKQRLIAEIRNGKYRPGSALPSIEYMAFEFKVSKNTVSLALASMRDQGIVELAQGKPTMVTGFLHSFHIEVIAYGVIPLQHNDFWGEMWRGICDVAAGYDNVIVDHCHIDSTFLPDLSEPPEYLRDNGGVILLGTTRYEYIEHLRKYNIPFILVHEKVNDKSVPTIYPAFEKVMMDAIGRFVEQGAKRIGYLGNQNLHCGIDIYKLECFKKALEKYGIPCEKSLIMSAEHLLDKAYNYTKDYLAANPELPDGLMLGSDTLLLGAFRAFKEAKIRIPEDLKVISCDNLDWGNYVTPAVDTIELFRYEMGKTAATRMVERLLEHKPLKSEIIDPVFIKK